MWIDADKLLLLRFIQRGKSTDHPNVVSDIRVEGYKEIQGYQIPTEFLVIRNGRPVWRERMRTCGSMRIFPLALSIRRCGETYPYRNENSHL